MKVLEKTLHSDEQNVWRLFNVELEIPFMASETELDCYHKQANLLVAKQFRNGF